MGGSTASGRRGEVLRYTIGGVWVLLTLVAMLLGFSWYWSLIGCCTAFVLILGSNRRIFRAGVSRSGGQIVCRYIPWYEGITYFSVIILPGFAVGGIAAAASDPDHLAWMRYVAIVLLCVAVVIIFGLMRAWCISVLCINPSALTIRLPVGLRNLTDIPREQIKSIESKAVALANGTQALRVEIAYRAADGEATKSVVFGAQFSVQPVNLVNALVAWNNGAGNNPTELLDRVEQILRSPSKAGV